MKMVNMNECEFKGCKNTWSHRVNIMDMCERHYILWKDNDTSLPEQAKRIFLETFCPYNDDIQIIQCNCKYCKELKKKYRVKE